MAATSLQTLIPLISSLALLLTLANTVQSLSKTTSFSYNFANKKPKSGLTYQGDAHYPSEPRVLRLTKTDDFGNALSYSVGRVLYKKPVMFWEKTKQTSFKTTVKFIIRATDGDDDYSTAKGLAFFIVHLNFTLPDRGGSFGVFDESGYNPSIFAVEFDIYTDEEFDPTGRHVGIDIQSQMSRSVTDVDDLIWQEVTALIAYNATTKLISVHGNAGAKKFEVSYVYDLSTILPKQVQVGISASTGGPVAVHDIISWSFNSNIVIIK